MIEWKAEYEIGVPSADYEHRKLVELVNELHDQALNAVSAEAAAAALSKIISHFTAHFSVEEAAMGDIDYAGLDGHRRDHEAIVKNINARLERLVRGEAVTKELAEEIELWLVQHFHNWDLDLYHVLDRTA